VGKFDGLYIGISGGGNWGKTKAQAAGFSPTLDITTSNTIDIASSGMMAGILARYGLNLYGLYIGIEGAGEIHSSQGKASNSSLVGNKVTTTLSIKKTNTLSIGARLGKHINKKLLLYMKGGIACSHYRLDSSVSVSGIIRAAASERQSKRINQFIAGIGAEHLIAVVGSKYQLVGGIDYEHAFAKKASINLSSSTYQLYDLR
jgi:opacity protein-like surface antigen